MVMSSMRFALETPIHLPQCSQRAEPRAEKTQVDSTSLWPDGPWGWAARRPCNGAGINLTLERDDENSPVEPLACAFATDMTAVGAKPSPSLKAQVLDLQACHCSTLRTGYSVNPRQNLSRTEQQPNGAVTSRCFLDRVRLLMPSPARQHSHCHRPGQRVGPAAAAHRPWAATVPRQAP